MVAFNRAIYHFTCQVLSHPLPLRLFFAVLRRIRPIAIIGGNVIVTKHQDVMDVLQRSEDFTLAEYTRPKMLGGSFLLSIDGPQQHTRERELLWSVVRPSYDIPWIRSLAEKECQNTIRGACNSNSGKGEIDVAAELTDRVALKIVTTYFGVQTMPQGPRQMSTILRRLASVILLEPSQGTREWTEARESIVDLTGHLSGLIRHKILACTGFPTPVRKNDDLLTRLVKRKHSGADPHPWFTEDWIRRYLTGLATFGNATISQTVCHALDQLLARPYALRRAQRAAANLTACQAGADNAQTLLMRNRMLQLIYEALRFRPMLPLLERFSQRETVLAKDTNRQRRIPAGARVIAGPLAAMFDPEVFDRPWHFNYARPIEDYVHFGYGPHGCFGKYVADAQIIEIMRNILLLKDITRAPGRQGWVQYEGPAVKSLHICFTSR